MGWANWNTAAIGALSPLMRPWRYGDAVPEAGGAQPLPGNRLSVTSARLKPCKFSNSKPGLFEGALSCWSTSTCATYLRRETGCVRVGFMVIWAIYAHKKTARLRAVSRVVAV